MRSGAGTGAGMSACSSRQVEAARRGRRGDTKHLRGRPGDCTAEREVVRRQDPDPGEAQPHKPQKTQERDGAAGARETTRAHAAGIGEDRRNGRAHPRPADVNHPNPSHRFLVCTQVEIMLNRATHPLCKTRRASQSQALVRRGSRL